MYKLYQAFGILLILLLSCTSQPEEISMEKRIPEDNNKSEDVQPGIEQELRQAFPDYEPKNTPDTVLDYRGSLYDEITTIPAPRLTNLPQLIKLLQEYEEKAKENPGYWEEGKIYLGADQDQYVPSDQELIYSDIGDRIQIVVRENQADDIKAVLKETGLGIKEIIYNKIGFWHADVMGSGRFFYATPPEEVRVLMGQ